MILLYDTGARIQEILDIKMKDIHLNDQIPCIYLTGKGHKTRAVPLMDKTIDHFHKYTKLFHLNADSEQYLFYTIIKGRKAGCQKIMSHVFSNVMQNLLTWYVLKFN